MLMAPGLERGELCCHGLESASAVTFREKVHSRRPAARGRQKEARVLSLNTDTCILIEIHLVKTALLNCPWRVSCNQFSPEGPMSSRERSSKRAEQGALHQYHPPPRPPAHPPDPGPPDSLPAYVILDRNSCLSATVSSFVREWQ